MEPDNPTAAAPAPPPRAPQPLKPLPALLWHESEEHAPHAVSWAAGASQQEEAHLLQPRPPAAAAGGSAAGDAASHLLDPAAWRRTTLLINLAGVVERIDEQLLPALYAFVGHSFQASPSQLGELTFARALVQALASPLAGLLGHAVDRVRVIACGAFLWGAMCLGYAATHTISQALPFWAANGVGLALLIPAAQSLTADLNPAHRRGRAFGLLHLTGAVGALLGTLLGTNLGHTRPFGIEGWRFAFAAVAAASWAIGVGVLALASDPRTAAARASKAVGRLRQAWRGAAREMAGVLSTPSFLIIVLQGIVGTTPWLALVFLTLHLQLLGFSDSAASLLLACFLGANALGGLLGGALGDAAAARWPRHGRVAVCQLSVGLGVPLSALLFKGLPREPGAASAALYALTLTVTGLTITWAATACNNPIFAEIVPAASRNLVFAFDRSFEGAIAACAAPLVGWLAQVAFDFEGSAEVGADAAANRRRADALGSALLVFTAVPWALCTVFFSGLHWSYPRDRERALQAAAAAAAEAAAQGAAAVELAVVVARPASPAGLSEGGLSEEDKATLLAGGSSNGGLRNG